MQLTTILTTVLAAAGLTCAASVSSRQTTRRQAGCRAVAADDINFAVADLTSGVETTEVLNFAVGPAAAGPCQLVGAFKKGFPVAQMGDALARLDVRALAGSDAPGSLVGSFGPLKVEDGVVAEDTVTVVNSFQCRPDLSFEFSVANDAEVDVDISVAFTASELGGFFVKVGDQC